MPQVSKPRTWRPLSREKLHRLQILFDQLFPADNYGSLAKDISRYWINRLTAVWEKKSPDIRKKDLAFAAEDPLSRIHQKTVVIAYADSVFETATPTLNTLNTFLKKHFPTVGGLHLLPACQVVEHRFNDGYFSQKQRNQIHERFGTNAQFGEMAGAYFSMADFVLNHVDIENPKFQAYLNNDDPSGDCFYVFSEPEYQARRDRGDFDPIFRPRPFPLFTIFRRTPTDEKFAKMDTPGRIKTMNRQLGPLRLPEAVIALLSVFNKIRNDQMLLDNDYAHILSFMDYLKKQTTIAPDALFTLSESQETRHPPYIFNHHIQTKADLLAALGHDPETARHLAACFDQHDPAVFGTEIRALTTFSHVQVDLNTTTLAGLKMLADDFSWYLSLDLNMLRLDAANFAFKQWKTPCFGLPQVKRLMQILHLSMDCVAPRMVANLEVNAPLSTILDQMADPDAPPPMMYDFHLASLLPVVFNLQNTDAAARISDLIRQYEIPKTSIRFSVADSHDGKSVRGSMDLLTPAEQHHLARIVEKNGGKIKTRVVPRGREPYELCISTKDALIKMADPALEANRFLAFYTMAFALMGRHVKSVYFNDLMGLGNDNDRVARTGELRDIKRTRSDYHQLEEILRQPDNFHSRVAEGMARLISLVDADPALNARGHEAELIATGNSAIACIHNHWRTFHSLIIISTSPKKASVSIRLPAVMAPLPETLFDQFTNRPVELKTGEITLETEPFQRLWLTTMDSIKPGAVMQTSKDWRP